MKTLLINPPYAFSEFPIIPMGLLYLAGVLEHNDHEVEVLDILVSKYTKDKVTRKLNQYQPDIVGITSVTMNYPTASGILKHCKSVNPDIKTVIGGCHVSFTAADTLNEAPWIDVVVIGEGEQTMLDIVSGKSLDQIDGIAYRSDDGVQLTRQRRPIEDLDALPLPAWHLFPLSRYHALASHLSLITGRGCPFNCIFCAGSKMVGRRARYRNAKLVVDEIEQGLSYGFKEVNFEDDLLTLNHRHLYAICDEIIARGLKFNWSAFSRVDTINPEVLQKMSDSGCTWLCYGVESGNQEVLDRIRKRITLDKIRDGVRMAKDAGINSLASFIIGLPGETKETLKDTVEFAAELDTWYGFHVLSPFPGTEVREKADEYGLEILTNDWSKYDANRPVSRTKDVGPQEIKAVLRKYYKESENTQVKPEEADSNKVETGKTRKRSPLAWALLSGDIIENLGNTDRNGNPEEDLAKRIAAIVPYPYQHIRDNIGKWVKDGLIKYDLKDNNYVWRWS